MADVPLRPLGATEVIDGAVRAVWAQRRAVFPIAAPFCVASATLYALFQYAVLRSRDAAVFSLIGQLLVGVLISTVVTGLTAPALAGTLLGRRLDARRCLRACGWRGVALVPLALVLVIGEGVGLVLLAVGGVWLWGVWAVAAPASTLERLGVVAALRRSFALVRGSFWRVWGTRALGGLTAYVLTQVTTLAFTAIALGVTDANPLRTTGQVTHQPGTYVLIVAFGTLLAALLTVPFSAGVDVLIYSDLRMRREGMDIELALPPLPAAVAQSAATTAW